MDLSIIIVSWNVRDLLAACLDSIAATTADGKLALEVIVVDSGSSGSSGGMVRSRFPWVRLIEVAENIGFTRSNNRGLEIAQGRHLLLLNPDTVVFPGALRTLVTYMDSNPDVGLVGPHVLNPDGTTQSTRRRFLKPIGGFFESTWLQGYAPHRILDHYYMTDKPDDGIFDVDWVQGCALMARREVYDQVGGLDTGYVMFFEEVDWCRRAKLAGWRVVYVGEARITHYGGQSTAQVETKKHIYFQQSKIRYYAKFYGPRTAFVLRIFLQLSYGAQWLQEGLKALLGHRRAMRRERMRTYSTVIRALGQRP